MMKKTGSALSVFSVRLVRQLSGLSRDGPGDDHCHNTSHATSASDFHLNQSRNKLLFNDIDHVILDCQLIGRLIFSPML